MAAVFIAEYTNNIGKFGILIKAYPFKAGQLCVDMSTENTD